MKHMFLIWVLLELVNMIIFCRQRVVQKTYTIRQGQVSFFPVKASKLS